MQNGNRFVDYIKEHKVPEILSGNRFIKLFPLDILYFGVADVAAVVYYDIFLHNNADVMGDKPRDHPISSV